MTIKPFRPVGSNEIIKFESVWDVNLPDNYKEFLTKNNGGIPSEKKFPIQNNPSDTHSVLDGFFGINTNNTYDLGKIFKNYIKSNRVPSGYIPIALDQCGNLLILSDSGEVFFWDHEEEGNNNIYEVAKSFEDLLNSLK